MGDTEQVKEIGTGPHFVLPKPIADIGPDDTIDSLEALKSKQKRPE